MRLAYRASLRCWVAAKRMHKETFLSRKSVVAPYPPHWEHFCQAGLLLLAACPVVVFARLTLWNDMGEEKCCLNQRLLNLMIKCI